MLETRLRQHWDGLPDRERCERRAIAVEYPDGLDRRQAGWSPSEPIVVRREFSPQPSGKGSEAIDRLTQLCLHFPGSFFQAGIIDRRH